MDQIELLMDIRERLVRLETKQDNTAAAVITYQSCVTDLDTRMDGIELLCAQRHPPEAPQEKTAVKTESIKAKAAIWAAIATSFATAIGAIAAALSNRGN
jgi:hypothetical protein